MTAFRGKLGLVMPLDPLLEHVLIADIDELIRIVTAVALNVLARMNQLRPWTSMPSSQYVLRLRPDIGHWTII
jgi:hypothetical protein